MLYSAYCTWFVPLLASPYAVLLRTCPYLFLAQFEFEFEFSLSWTDLLKASTEDSDHAIS